MKWESLPHGDCYETIQLEPGSPGVWGFSWWVLQGVGVYYTIVIIRSPPKPYSNCEGPCIIGNVNRVPYGAPEYDYREVYSKTPL